MFEQIKIVFKKYLGSPLIALAIVFFILAGATVLFSGKSTKTLGVITENKQAARVKSVKSTATPTQEAQESSNTSTNSYQQPTTASSTPTPYKTETTTTTNSSNNSNGSSQTQGRVKLSINGSSTGEVNVGAGQNQCDVLNDALAQGKISQLTMRYESSLGTYGVYKINNTGKDNSIWWTYKVNGNSPDKGCSYLGVNNGDSVEWNYIGS